MKKKNKDKPVSLSKDVFEASANKKLELSSLVNKISEMLMPFNIVDSDFVLDLVGKQLKGFCELEKPGSLYLVNKKEKIPSGIFSNGNKGTQ